MTDHMSPAAEAVLLAADENSERFGHMLAAALRSAADQVVPEENVDDADYDCLHAKWGAYGAQEVREKLLTIATELEGSN